jgi:hypothetical protein
MDLSELKRWRKMVPAIMLACAIWPLIQSFLKFLSKDLGYVGDDDKLFSLLLAGLGVPVAVIYDALDFRRVLSWPSSIRTHLATGLWTIISSSSEGQGLVLTTMPSEKDMVRLFYKQIDADESLKELANRVRSNGLAASSCVDGSLILGSIGFITVVVSIFVDNLALILWGTCLSAGSVLCYWMIPLLTQRHLDLSRDQLTHIDLFGRDKLISDYKKMAKLNG